MNPVLRNALSGAASVTLFPVSTSSDYEDSFAELQAHARERHVECDLAFVRRYFRERMAGQACYAALVLGLLVLACSLANVSELWSGAVALAVPVLSLSVRYADLKLP